MIYNIYIYNKVCKRSCFPEKGNMRLDNASLVLFQWPFKYVPYSGAAPICKAQGLIFQRSCKVVFRTFILDVGKPFRTIRLQLITNGNCTGNYNYAMSILICWVTKATFPLPTLVLPTLSQLTHTVFLEDVISLPRFCVRNLLVFRLSINNVLTQYGEV